MIVLARFLYFGIFGIFMYAVNCLIFGKNYTAGKNFTPAPVVTVVTNFISNFMF